MGARVGAAGGPVLGGGAAAALWAAGGVQDGRGWSAARGGPWAERGQPGPYAESREGAPQVRICVPLL